MIGELTKLSSPVCRLKSLNPTRWYPDCRITNRVGDDAASPVLDFREDVAGHQAGGGAAQDDVFSHETLYVLEDALLDI